MRHYENISKIIKKILKKCPKMSLNCPICGKKYYYDMKICQKCEDSSNYSNLISNDGKREWRCDAFLDLNHFVFGKKK